MAQSFTIAQAPTATVLTSSAGTAPFGQTVTFTATVNSAAAGLAGTVTFMDGSTSLGTGTLSGGIATLTTSTLPAGSHSITAAYSGSANFLASTSAPLSQTVTSSPFSATGRTLHDWTGNGLSDDDGALGGTTVNLYRDVNGNGTLDSGDGSSVATTTSDNATGAYRFDIATAGRYFIQEVVPSGYVRTVPALSSYYTVNAATGGSAAGQDFDNFYLCTPKTDVTNVVYTINGTEVVTDLRGNVDQGDTVAVTFTVPAGHTDTVTLVSYTAPGAAFDANNAGQQTIWDQSTGTFGPGTYTIEVQIPDTYFQVDFVCGKAIDHFGPANSNIFYSAQNRLISADNDGTQAYVAGSSSISGFVYLDANNDGVKQTGETAIAGATVRLSGTDTQGHSVSATGTTDSRGRWVFANVMPGTYQVTEVQPAGYIDGRDTLGTGGGTVISDGFTGIVLGAAGARSNYNFGELKAATLSGYVYVDANNNGVKDSGESGLSGVTLTLTDAAGHSVATTTTSCSGAYTFSNLMPGAYTITETQAAGYVDGDESAGTLGGVVSDDYSNIITSINAGAGQTGTGYNFGELREVDVTRGDAATIGFWKGKNGQALIKAFNGSSSSRTLATWLSSMFPSIYGTGSVNCLVGKTNTNVASLFATLYNSASSQLDAQVLGVALAIYSTTSSLGGTAAGAYGFTVSSTGTGARAYNVGNSGLAFDVANNTTMLVIDILSAANDHAVSGVLYNGDAILRGLASIVFGGIDQQGGIC